MKNRVRKAIGGLLLAVLWIGSTGCKSFSPNGSGRWLTPSKTAPTDKETGRKTDPGRPDAPAVRGQSVVSSPAFSNDFSTPDVYSVRDGNVPDSTGMVSGTVNPMSTVTNESVSSPRPSARPVSPPPETIPMTDPWMAAASGSSETPSTFDPSSPSAPRISRQSDWETAASPLPTASSGMPSAFDEVYDDPWGFGLPESGRGAVSIDAAAKKEEEAVRKHQQEQEKIRLERLAASGQTSPHLQPLTKWNGPFESREKKQTIEQDIIQQVGHVEVTPARFDNTPVFEWEKEEEKGFDWDVLDPVNFFKKLRDLAGMGPDEKKAQAAMKKGRELLLETPDLKDRKKALEAAKQFAEAAKRWPDSVVEEDALHLAAECYFFADDYPRAMKRYQTILIKYQHSKHIDNAVRRLFKIAKYWEEEDRRGVPAINVSEKSRPTFDTFGFCQKAYESIFTYDPNGPISDDAVMALASAHMARGRYQGDVSFEKAAYYFAYLRENYPLSRHIAKAHEFELTARTRAYLGAEYNGKTLDEAGRLAEMTIRQFSGELERNEKDEVLALKEDVIEKQAEREWILGQYYEKKKYYRSAGIYYEKLLDKYPQTDYAERARQRLEEIRGLPAKPDQFELIKKLYMPRGSFQ